MKGSKGGSSSSPPVAPQSGALLVGAAGATLLSGAGGTTVVSCKDGDNSFYCKFVRGFNILKMVLVVIVLILLGYFAYKVFFSGNGSKKK
jgi:hypothetical protein